MFFLARFEAIIIYWQHTVFQEKTWIGVIRSIISASVFSQVFSSSAKVLPNLDVEYLVENT